MSILKKLEENRIPILLAEIGAYLHLIGRFSKEFISSHAKNSSEKFEYDRVCEYNDFWENTGLNDILRDNNWENLINDFKNLQPQDASNRLLANKVKNFCDFIRKHEWKIDKSGNLKPEEGLCRILADAHGIVSGIDKALAGRGKSGKQRREYTYRATAFGYETVIEFLEDHNLDNVDAQKISEKKKKLFTKLKDILENIKNSNNIDYEGYRKFVSTIKHYYSMTIGETRRPINEISLYDYAHTIASLMKSNLAKMIIEGWYEPRGKSKWRILKVNVDVLGLLSKGLKVGDILGHKRELEKTFDKIKKLLEYKYPLGNEIYRDTTGIYFSCPNIEDSTKLSELKEEILEKIASISNLDFSLQVEISEESRSMVILSKIREKSLKDIIFHHVSNNVEHIIKSFKKSKEGNDRKDLCPVCRLRLKSVKEDRCNVCKERYERRAKKWIENPKETIWLDEVADKNDRVALIVGCFDLEKWLSGDFVATFVSQTFDDWKNENQTLCQRLGINTVEDLKACFENMFNNPNSLNSNQKKLCKTFINIRLSNFIDDFWNPIAERDATGTALNLISNSERADWLVRLLFRKHPSLARIYRIWNTTQEFIKKTVFDRILKNYEWKPEIRRKRIKFKIEPNPNIRKGSTCDIDIDGVRFSPICIDRSNSIFISTINLEILKKFGGTAEEITKNLNDKIIRIKRESDRKWKKGFKIVSAELADDKFQDYLPYVIVYDTPDQFMIFIPASEALDIAEKIIKEYEKQFSKVRDRLPLHLGIIAFHRKMPLYVVMDAGRRLLQTFKEKSEEFKRKSGGLVEVVDIQDIDDEDIGKCKELTLRAEEYSSVEFKWKISYSTKDPDVKDHVKDRWHPYIRIYGGNPNRPSSFDYTGNGDYLVHVEELKKNDKIIIEPSYFALIYLENFVDRFKIDESIRPLHDIHRIKELWNIIKSKNWSASQIHAFWEELIKRREYGDELFEKFLKDNLINILDISPSEDKELFKKFFDASKDGLLNLCLYWYLSILKERIGGREVE